MLREAVAATGDQIYKTAEKKLIDYICRIQVESDEHPYLGGAWLRAFDYNRWEYWGLNSDLGWGAWCIETGFSQQFILMSLALHEMDKNFWDLTKDNNISKWFEKNKSKMIPD